MLIAVLNVLGVDLIAIVVIAAACSRTRRPTRTLARRMQAPLIVAAAAHRLSELGISA